MTRRTERISEQIRDELARVLRENATDPRLSRVSLLRVDVAPDLSNAIVFWSTLDANGEVDLDATGEGLESAAGFLRHQLANALPLRRVPALRFRRDPSLELGSRTLHLLRSLRDGEEA